MRKYDLYWQSNRDWWYINDDCTPVVKDDAPQEAKESYQRYLDQIYYGHYLTDSYIAERAIEESKLLIGLTSRPVCDVYCIPSHNHQAFFVRVYQKADAFLLAYAKPYHANWLGSESVMYTFQAAIDADHHMGKCGHIYCGLKYVPLDDPVMNELVQALPQKSEYANSRSMELDGAITLIRAYPEHSNVILGYRNADDMIENTMSNNQKQFLNELYLQIETLIGNLKEKRNHHG